MPCASGMTVPSTQSIVLIVIQLKADSRRHNYQHIHYTTSHPKNQDGIMGVCAISCKTHERKHTACQGILHTNL